MLVLKKANAMDLIRDKRKLKKNVFSYYQYYNVVGTCKQWNCLSRQFHCIHTIFGLSAIDNTLH